MRTIFVLPLLVSLAACASEPATVPDGKLEVVPHVEPDAGGACQASADCRSDEVCDLEQCIPADARSFRLTFREAQVGSVNPTGGAWETSSWNTTVEPDLYVTVRWLDDQAVYDQGYVEYETRCATSEVSDRYTAYWNDACFVTPTPRLSSFGLGPDSYWGDAIQISLWDADSFDSDLAATWVFEDAAALDELAAADGEAMRLEVAADGGEGLWLEFDVDVVVSQ